MIEVILVYEILNSKKIFRIQGDFTKIDLFESIRKINYSYTHPSKIFIKMDEYIPYHSGSNSIVHPVIRYIVKQYENLLVKYNIPAPEFNYVDNIFISPAEELINEDIKSLADIYGSILNKLNKIINEESTKLMIHNEPSIYRLVSNLMIPDSDYSRLIGYMISSNKQLMGKINQHEINNYDGSFKAGPVKFESIKTTNNELISILKYNRFETQDIIILDSPKIKLWSKGWLYNNRII